MTEFKNFNRLPLDYDLHHLLVLGSTIDNLLSDLGPLTKKQQEDFRQRLNNYIDQRHKAIAAGALADLSDEQISEYLIAERQYAWKECYKSHFGKYPYS